MNFPFKDIFFSIEQNFPFLHTLLFTNLLKLHLFCIETTKKNFLKIKSTL